ncbi:MAG: HEAT repeat domain-containing protein [Armatimonadota bacterium]
MIVYHGTTKERARRIAVEGFHPRKPSRRVWFAQSRDYALGRAKTQAKRAKDTAVVLTCDVDVAQLRKWLGGKKVFHSHGIIAIKASVPARVLRSHPGDPGYADQPSSLDDLAAWINAILGLKAYKGVNTRNPGLERLSRWVVNRMTSQPRSRIRPTELLHMARRWLPDFFEGVEIDPETMLAHRRVATVEMAVDLPPEPVDPREEEALDCLVSDKPARRARGLSLLTELADPDLFDWCVTFLGDEAEIQIAALHAMLSCDEVELDLVLPLASIKDRRVRAAAIAVLAKHGGQRAVDWFARGLKDPESCVRVETARQLSALDVAKHKDVFELALHDPNPEVRHRAQKVAAGKALASRW